MRGLIFTNKIAILVMTSLFLSGCSISKETFDCTYGKGVGCRSITEVNGMVNNGKLVGGNSSVINTATAAKQTAPLVKANAISSDQITVNRVLEEHLRVWIAPYQDEHGNFHEGAVVHTILKSGFWQIT